MNREEATNLLKEIFIACGAAIREEAIILMPPDADDVLSHGYQLHIKAKFGKENIDCIKPLVEKHNLAIAVEENKQLLFIYKPIK